MLSLVTLSTENGYCYYCTISVSFEAKITSVILIVREPTRIHFMIHLFMQCQPLFYQIKRQIAKSGPQRIMVESSKAN